MVCHVLLIEKKPTSMCESRSITTGDIRVSAVLSVNMCIITTRIYFEGVKQSLL